MFLTNSDEITLSLSERTEVKSSRISKSSALILVSAVTEVIGENIGSKNIKTRSIVWE
jgi:hypothetical protein